MTGVLPVAGSWRQHGIIPYAGLAWIGQIVIPVEVFVDLGYGLARHHVELHRAQPIVDGSDTTGILRARFGFEVPITPGLRIGTAASYLRSGNNDFRVLPGGPASSFGTQDQWGVIGSLSMDILWRNETSGRFVAWHLDTAQSAAVPLGR